MLVIDFSTSIQQDSAREALCDLGKEGVGEKQSPQLHPSDQGRTKNNSRVSKNEEDVNNQYKKMKRY